MRSGPEPERHGAIGADERRLHDRLVHHRARVHRFRQGRVLVHQPREQVLIEASPIHADPHRLAVIERDLDDFGELPVALVLEADISGIDAVFGERRGARRMLLEQGVAVIVEVADERRLDPEPIEPLFDVRHGGGRLGAVDRDPDKFRARARQRGHLRGRGLDIGRVGIGHRLHDDRRIAADRDAADPDRNCAPSRFRLHGARIHHICSGRASIRP